MNHQTADVTISTGTIRGVTEGAIARYLGIPYAEPPVGERRFAAPVARKPWQGVREATEFGPTASQSAYQGALATLLASVSIPGDDVLTLNVWAPVNAKSAPVVVWIHGGALERGAAALPSYDGTAFARDGVVFVSINYRLGAEGFSVLEGAPRNIGLLDAGAALTWVRREIAAFGGDPSRITLMGESAGGTLVAALLARRSTRSLVARAIIESGPLEVSTTKKAARATTALAKKLGIPATREAFLAVSAEELVQARIEITRGGTLLSGTAGFALTTDPDTLPLSPHTVLPHIDTPLLIGTNTDEYRLWLTPEAIADIGAFKASAARLALKIPYKAAAAAKSAWVGSSHGEVLGQLLTDKVLRGPATTVAGVKSSSTFMYEFAWQSPVRGLGAAHALEIGFIFDTLDASDSISLVGENAPQLLANEMHRSWVAFITGGDPGWPAYRPQRLTRVFDAASVTRPQRRTAIVDAL
ncbi:para-nitrobenzyl esterase [Microbacterium endophyticum]|uniref:Carboxylic ester hydrolase n=1 Tax=Microbacterium endophyticum TaxID=1526412 RepID=A0A7W4V3F7_9MICO|nr:carboxylesterase family protein [Microbacterium endophyticum]MBB2976183.1 para-nitrobenzyl esterase [Microbacterium endophyticum]NIK36480.1 para-nitrobenzyl esterase [Microbacterium endophyticum]